MELFLKSNAPESFLLQLLVDYLKLKQRGKVHVIELSRGALIAISEGKLKLSAPSLITSTGEVVQDIVKIAWHLVGETQWTEFFFGETAQQKQEISKAQLHIKAPKEQLKYLQKYLESRTFFVGNHLTFADLVIFTKIHDIVCEFDDTQKSGFCNVFRWYKNIQNQPAIKEFLAKEGRVLVTDPVYQPGFAQKKGK